jgi:hypothetical protein
MNTNNLTTQVPRIGGIEPEFFRLPIAGNDPHSRGWIKLKRLRQSGKLRGVTLIPYQSVKEFLSREEAGHE